MKRLGLPPMARTVIAAVAVANAVMASMEVLCAAPTITNLGTISDEWFAGSSATGISDDGAAVVGTSTVDIDTFHAFRWTSDAGMQDLGTLSDEGQSDAFGLSGDGSVVVGVNTSPSIVERAFHWTASGGMIDLGTLPKGDRSWAYGISSDGSVVVGTSTENGLPHAFRWTAAEGMQDIGTLPNGAWAAAGGVSGDGAIVVGNALNVCCGGGLENLRAFRWTASGGMQSLGTLPGGRFSQEPSANADGSVIVGSANFAGPDIDAQHVFRWTSEGGMQDLGCPPGGYSCNAYDVSGDGSAIVGRSITQGRALLWTAQLGMVDLNTYLSTLGLDLAGWELIEARAISADGSAIVGNGFYNGDTRAWLVTGVPPALPGDYNGNGSVDAADYVVWRKGISVVPTEESYNNWRSHFGQTAGNGAGGSDSLSAGIPEPATAILLLIGSVVAIRRPRRWATTELAKQQLSRRFRIDRGSHFAASTLLVLLGSASARGTTIEFVYRGTFEYVDAEPDATFDSIAPGATWTARLLFDGAAQNQYPPYLYDQSLAVYQGISVDLTIGDSSIQFEPLWIGVADNCCEWVRGGNFFDAIDVTVGSSAELYLGLNDPTLAAIHSTALPATINLADWPNHDIVFSPSGVYATGPIDRITSRMVSEPTTATFALILGTSALLRRHWTATSTWLAPPKCRTRRSLMATSPSRTHLVSHSI
jgi:probable HAF family extracellular repeat protein